MVAGNPLLEVQKYGQSIWYDDIGRGLLTSGELRRMIEEDGILGLTSNPTIFEKAIAHSADYDQALRRLVAEGKDAPEIYEALVVEDIRLAADTLRSVYERTAGRDGYASIEVSPNLAYSTASTVAEARRLWEIIGRDNVMVKVPATPEGLPAIEQLIGQGININITLIFSLEVYERVMDAYLAGLEKLVAAGRSPGGVASVASFFVSRIDTAVDRLLEERLATAQSAVEAAELRGLLGKAAIASSKVAYARFQEVFSPSASSGRFAALHAKGARVQRPLWASTGTKNPAYSDVRYVEELIGPDTVNTAPSATIAAFKGHGVARLTVVEELDEAREVLRKLAELSINMEEVTQKLLDDGVRAFAASLYSLLESISDRQSSIRGESLRRFL
jgi:transaldolase